MTRVKICCISTVEEARLAVREGASAVGLVSEMPSGPGVITEDSIAEIAAVVPPPVGTFLLTNRTDPTEILSQQKHCGVNTIQICDRLVPGAQSTSAQVYAQRDCWIQRSSAPLWELLEALPNKSMQLTRVPLRFTRATEHRRAREAVRQYPVRLHAQAGDAESAGCAG